MHSPTPSLRDDIDLVTGLGVLPEERQGLDQLRAARRLDIAHEIERMPGVNARHHLEKRRLVLHLRDIKARRLLRKKINTILHGPLATEHPDFHLFSIGQLDRERSKHVILFTGNQKSICQHLPDGIERGVFHSAKNKRITPSNPIQCTAVLRHLNQLKI